jgi:hypothetical protein
MHGNNTKKLPVYLSYLKLVKTPCFSFYLLCFFFYKIGEQEGRTDSAGEGGALAPAGVGKW